MICELRVSGFRILRDFTWYPKDGVNILVGENSAGKSTVLDAIELVLRGSLRGHSPRYAIAPDWFNQDNVANFFEKVKAGDSTLPIPEITIVATFKDEPELAAIKGCNGPDGKIDPAPGIFLTYRVPAPLQTEFFQEARRLCEVGGTPTIPTDYYELEWKVFQGGTLARRPNCIGCSRINITPEPYSRVADRYAHDYVTNELDEETQRGVASKFREVRAQVDNEILSSLSVNHIGSDALGIKLDESPRSDWTNSVVLHRDGLPLSVLGSAEQTLTKCAISFERSSDETLFLLEEPECHLSHTSLNELLALIERNVKDGRQAFITTHSPFVLNRLGLDRLSVIVDGENPIRIGDLTEATVRYFKRISGYDTLRVALARRSVLVEGPSDEMVFVWAFRKERRELPIKRGIDVIECGTQHRRLLELASALGKKGVVALRDNDGKSEKHWTNAVKTYLGEGRKMICGHYGEGETLEPQMIHANKENLPLLAQIVGKPGSKKDKIEQYMSNHETEWALDLLEADTAKTSALAVPQYIREAIDFIDPTNDSAHE